MPTFLGRKVKSLNNRHIRHASISRCKNNASNCYYNYAQGLAKIYTGQFDLEPPPPKITRFRCNILTLEEVQSFLDWRGFSEEAITIASSMNKLTYFTAKVLTLLNRLYTLDDYFHPIYLIFYYSLYHGCKKKMKK